MKAPKFHTTKLAAFLLVIITGLACISQAGATEIDAVGTIDAHDDGRGSAQEAVAAFAGDREVVLVHLHHVPGVEVFAHLARGTEDVVLRGWYTDRLLPAAVVGWARFESRHGK